MKNISVLIFMWFIVYKLGYNLSFLNCQLYLCF